MKLIGITGGVGAGKSEILSFIKKHYRCEIILADEAANRIKLPGEACYEKLVKLLGREVLDEKSFIDKNKMAAKIFFDKSLLNKVNAIIHPMVREYLEKEVDRARREGNVELFFIEAALLIENGYCDFVDEMWYIYASADVRRERLKKYRGYDDAKIDRIMASQLSEEHFRLNSDFVVDNSSTLEAAYGQIMKRLEAYQWQE